MCTTQFLKQTKALFVVYLALLTAGSLQAAFINNGNAQVNSGEQQFVEQGTAVEPFKDILDKYEQQLRNDIREGRDATTAEQRLVALKLFLQRHPHDLSRVVGTYADVGTAVSPEELARLAVGIMSQQGVAEQIGEQVQQHVDRAFEQKQADMQAEVIKKFGSIPEVDYNATEEVYKEQFQLRENYYKQITDYQNFTKPKTQNYGGVTLAPSEFDIEKIYLEHLDPDKLNARLREINQQVYAPKPATQTNVAQEQQGLPYTENEKDRQQRINQERYQRDNFLEDCSIFAQDTDLKSQVWAGLRPQRLEPERLRFFEEQQKLAADRSKFEQLCANNSQIISEKDQEMRALGSRLAAAEQSEKGLLDTVKTFFAPKDLLHDKSNSWRDNFLGLTEADLEAWKSEEQDRSEFEEGSIGDEKFVEAYEAHMQKLMQKCGQGLKKYRQKLLAKNDIEGKENFDDFMNWLKGDGHELSGQYFDTLLQGIEKTEAPEITPPGAPTGPVTMPPAGTGDPNLTPVDGPKNSNNGASTESGLSKYKWHFVIGTTLFCVVAAPTAFAVAYKKAWLPQRLQGWTARMLAKLKRLPNRD